MKSKTCQVIVDGKECGLDLEGAETEIDLVSSYRCALGHRTHMISTKKPNHPRGGRIHDPKKTN